ncbi:MAG: hypothetical protein Q4A48_00050 [Bacillota bacterium]|nr:hypothetical protein [Bacillota bacterium]
MKDNSVERNERIMKKALTWVTVVIMAIAMMFTAMPVSVDTAQATEGDPGMIQGMSGDYLAKYVRDDGAQIIWYGPKAWWVVGYGDSGLDNQGTAVNEGAITLFSKEILENVAFSARGNNQYYYSTLKQYLDGYVANFSQIEQDAIVRRNIEGGSANYNMGSSFKRDGVKGPGISNAVLWAISWGEFWGLYGEVRWPGDYWLRSPNMSDSTAIYSMGSTVYQGDAQGSVYEYRGARPAFWLNMESIAFVSTAEGGKPSAGTDSLKEVQPNPGREWKLTLKDSSRTSFSVSNVKSQGGSTIRFNYSGAVTDDNEYISAAIVDSSGKVTRYGRLASANASSGTVTINNTNDWDPADGEKLYIFNEQYNGDKATDYVSNLAEITESMIVSEDQLSGDGSANNPYVITGTNGWNQFAALVNGGDSMEGKFVKLGDNVKVGTMVGTSSHKFSGTFDGAGHKLTISKTATGERCAPFLYTDNATFKNIHVKGTITTGYKFAAGLVANAAGATTVTNCRSSVKIVSSVDGDGTHGGFVAVGNVIFEGCLFDGSIIGEQTILCAGFLGYTAGGNFDCVNCLFDAKAIKTADKTANFIRTSDNATNSYYTWAIGQGRDRGKLVHSITAGDGVDIDFGESTEYDVSGITAYSTGLGYDGAFYAGKDDVVTVTMPDISDKDRKYVVRAGQISGSGTEYQITMPDEDVEVNWMYSRFPAPQGVVIKPSISMNGLVSKVEAEWEESDGAVGYYLTPCRIEDGKWKDLCDPIDVSEPEATDGKITYNLTEWVVTDHIEAGGGEFGFKVQAYDGEGEESRVINSSTDEIYEISLRFGLDGPSFIAHGGSNIGAAIYEKFLRQGEGSGYYERDGEYYYEMGSPKRIICFAPKDEFGYDSLADMEADSYLRPGQPFANVSLKKNIQVHAVTEEAVCENTGDLHKWKEIVEPARFYEWGYTHYECPDCGGYRSGDSIPPLERVYVEKSSYAYTGKAVKAKIVAMNTSPGGGERLKEGKDYKLTYSDNTNVGRATVKVTFIERYAGTSTMDFRIKPAKMSDVRIADIAAKGYTGKAIKPAPVVKLGNVKMNAKNYTLIYTNNTEIGKATIILVGKGNLTGVAVKTFRIVKGKNPLKVKGKTATVKYSKLKKKTQLLKVSKVLKFTNKGIGNVTYMKKKGDKKITIAKKTGKVTLKKGLKKGTYKVKIKIKAAGNSKYKAGTKTVTVKIKVK